jgi:class 3 adenylate cyclase
LIGTSGDGLVDTFAGPARAARAGLEIRGVMQTLSLELRTGVHTAESELTGDDIAGVGVHIGARVAGLAEPGEVWTSRTVRDLTPGSGLRFDERGRHHLRGVDEEWDLFSVSA